MDFFKLDNEDINTKLKLETERKIEKRKLKLLRKKRGREDKIRLYIERPHFLRSLFESVKLPPSDTNLFLTLPEIRAMIEKQRLEIQYNVSYKGPDASSTPSQANTYYNRRRNDEKRLVAAVSDDELKSLVKQYWRGKVWILNCPSEIPVNVLSSPAGLAASTDNSTNEGFEVQQTVKETKAVEEFRQIQSGYSNIHSKEDETTDQSVFIPEKTPQVSELFRDTGLGTNVTDITVKLNKNEAVPGISNSYDEKLNGQQQRNNLGLQQGLTHNNIEAYAYPKRIRRRLQRKGKKNSAYEAYTNFLISKYNVKKLREEIREQAVQAASMPQTVRKHFKMKHTNDEQCLYWASIATAEQYGGNTEVNSAHETAQNNVGKVYNNLIKNKHEVKKLRKEIRMQAVQAVSMFPRLRAKILMGHTNDMQASRWASIAAREQSEGLSGRNTTGDTVLAPIKHKKSEMNGNSTIFVPPIWTPEPRKIYKCEPDYGAIRKEDEGKQQWQNDNSRN